MKGLNKNPNVVLVRYEDLVTQPNLEAKRIFDFLSIDYSPWHTRHITTDGKLSITANCGP
jgi:hypothetical protein